MSDDHTKTEKKGNSNLALGIAIGVAIGAGIGVALGNIALGIGVGVRAAVAVVEPARTPPLNVEPGHELGEVLRRRLGHLGGEARGPEVCLDPL